MALAKPAAAMNEPSPSEGARNRAKARYDAMDLSEYVATDKGKTLYVTDTPESYASVKEFILAREKKFKKTADSLLGPDPATDPWDIKREVYTACRVYSAMYGNEPADFDVINKTLLAVYLYNRFPQKGREYALEKATKALDGTLGTQLWMGKDF